LHGAAVLPQTQLRYVDNFIDAAGMACEASAALSAER
jgi:hypothetical protein